MIRNKNKLLAFCSFFLCLLVVGLSEEARCDNRVDNMKSISGITQDKWDMLASKRMYFGHQSVGFNIIAGVNDILERNSFINLDIKDLDKVEDLSKPFLAHSAVGRNRFPDEKVSAFSEVMLSDFGGHVDVAFLKFCYVDAKEGANVEQMLAVYDRGIEEIRKARPNVVIVHFTIPIRAIPNGFVDRTKRRFGVGVLHKKAMGNIVKRDFNSLLLAKYGDKDLVFDIAKIESTAQNGESCTFRYKGRITLQCAKSIQMMEGILMRKVECMWLNNCWFF